MDYNQLKNKPWPLLKNDLILRVIAGEKVNHLPVWIMRQAGRYLPEFREIRKHADFFTMVKTPELACKITLQPIQRYQMDAAIIFSDILIICQAIGMDVQMLPGIGPHFNHPLLTPHDINNLNFNFNADVEFEYLMKSICLTRHTLNGQCPLIGFSGAAWTLMAYMTDQRSTPSSGGGSRSFTASRRWLYQFESDSIMLLEKLTQAIVKLLICQYKSGAQILMLFESHADLLNLELFKKYSLPFLQSAVSQVKQITGPNFPLIIFAKGAHYAIEDLMKTEFDVIALDWTINITENLINMAKNNHKTLMGNFDPAFLYTTSDEKLQEYTRNMLQKFKGVNYIVNLGHGILPDVDPNKVALFVKTIRES